VKPRSHLVRRYAVLNVADFRELQFDPHHTTIRLPDIVTAALTELQSDHINYARGLTNLKKMYSMKRTMVHFISYAHL